MAHKTSQQLIPKSIVTSVNSTQSIRQIDAYINNAGFLVYMHDWLEYETLINTPVQFDLYLPFN